jgi:hypothetical protein
MSFSVFILPRLFRLWKKQIGDDTDNGRKTNTTHGEVAELEDCTAYSHCECYGNDNDITGLVEVYFMLDQVLYTDTGDRSRTTAA